MTGTAPTSHTPRPAPSPPSPHGWAVPNRSPAPTAKPCTLRPPSPTVPHPHPRPAVPLGPRSPAAVRAPPQGTRGPSRAGCQPPGPTRPPPSGHAPEGDAPPSPGQVVPLGRRHPPTGLAGGVGRGPEPVPRPSPRSVRRAPPEPVRRRPPRHRRGSRRTDAARLRPRTFPYFFCIRSPQAARRGDRFIRARGVHPHRPGRVRLRQTQTPSSDWNDAPVPSQRTDGSKIRRSTKGFLVTSNAVTPAHTASAEREWLLECARAEPVLRLLDNCGWARSEDPKANIYWASPDRRVFVGWLPESPEAAFGELWHISIHAPTAAARGAPPSTTTSPRMPSPDSSPRSSPTPAAGATASDAHGQEAHHGAPHASPGRYPPARYCSPHHGGLVSCTLTVGQLIHGRISASLTGSVPAVAGWRPQLFAPRVGSTAGVRAAVRTGPEVLGGAEGQGSADSARPSRAAWRGGCCPSAGRHRLARGRDRGAGQGLARRAAAAAVRGRRGTLELPDEGPATVFGHGRVPHRPGSLSGADRNLHPGDHGAGLREGRTGWAPTGSATRWPPPSCEPGPRCPRWAKYCATAAS
jgi:hypothetical protein